MKPLEKYLKNLKTVPKNRPISILYDKKERYKIAKTSFLIELCQEKNLITSGMARNYKGHIRNCIEYNESVSDYIYNKLKNLLTNKEI